MEIWKEIKGYPSYEVSNLGRVKSNNYRNTGKSRLLKLQESQNGYNVIMLSHEGNRRFFKVHRLVAQAFLGLDIEDRLNTVNHIDEVKTNNALENLELLNVRQNKLYSTQKGRQLPFNISETPENTYRVKFSYGTYSKGSSYWCGISLGTYKTLEQAVKQRDCYLSDMREYEGFIVEPVTP